ncbi:TPA: phospholipase D-like domain-containing protein, partial [Vibrio parahaemolyticus]
MKVALDIPSYWEEHIRTAKFDVTIISPYITDSRAVKAFLNKAQEQSCQCQLVTHSDAIQHISSRPQLEQMKRALEMGTSVSMVSKLHAKALIVDGKLLSIGSQNFTKNGEQNVEL